MGIISSAKNTLKKVVNKVGSLGASAIGALQNATGRSTLPTYTPIAPRTQTQLYSSSQKDLKGKTITKPNSQNSNLSLRPGQFGGETNAGQSSNGKFQGAAINTATGAFVPITYKSNAGRGSSVYTDGSVVDTSNSSANFRSSPSVGVTDVGRNTGVQGGISSVINTPSTFLQDKNFYDQAAVPPFSEKEQVLKEEETNFQKMIDDLTAPENKEDVYAKLEREKGIAEKEQAAKLVEDKIRAINAKAEANQLSLIGQGRGIPEAIIGGQQAQISREAAIAVLPLSAEYAARKGDLDMARDSLEKLYQIKSADIDAKTSHQNKVIELVYGFADKKTKAKLDDIKLKNQYQREDLKEIVKQQNDYVELAFKNNQYSLASKIRLLDHNSKTYLNDLNNLASQLRNKAPTSSGSSASSSKYTVQSGDVPQFIADKSGLTLETLLTLNPGVNWNNLQPGQKLNTNTGDLKKADTSLNSIQLSQELYKQIATPEFNNLSSGDKKLYIQSQGGNPSDYGF